MRLTRRSLLGLIWGATCSSLGQPVSSPVPTGSRFELVLSRQLASWVQEIQVQGRCELVILPVFPDAAGLPRYAGPPGILRPELAKFFENLAFLREFEAMHAANVNVRLEAGGWLSAVVLNMRRYYEWAPYLDAVIAHELGHVWLHVLDYPAPVFTGQQDACVAVAAQDMVQHPLIRDEQRRREIPYWPYWEFKLATQLRFLESVEQPLEKTLPACRQVVLMSEWVDMRLGLNEDQWPALGQLEKQLRRHFPSLVPFVESLAELVGSQDLRQRPVYERTLKEVVARTYRAYEGFRRPGG